MHNGNNYKGRRQINLREAQTGTVLPDHFKEAYPKFISLLEKYYEHLDENNPTELIDHLFQARDITETDLTLLNFIEDELLLGESYSEGFPDKRAAANFASILFRAKGSKFAIEWFFRSFFGEDVLVSYPKNDLFNIGSSKIGPDSLKFITNNALYQTFSLLIKAGLPFSQWKDIFKLFAHPAGMYLGAEVLLEGTATLLVTGDGETNDFTTATYSMSASAEPGVEGTSITITITGTNVPHGGTEALFWYVVHGTSSNDDFSVPVPTSGSPQYVEISGSTGSFDLTIVKDLERDDGETYTVYLVDQYSTQLDTLALTIQDDLPVYTVSNSNVVEGNSLTFNVTLDDAFYDGVDLNWTLTGALASDPRVLSTSGTVNISSQTGTITINTTSSDVFQDVTNGTVTVSDVRFTAPVTGSGSATLTDAPATYAVTVTPVGQSEGDTVTVTVTGTNIEDSTNLYLQVVHVDTDNADFSSTPPGNTPTPREAIVMTSNTGSTTLTFASNGDTTNEDFDIEIHTDISASTEVASDTYTIIGTAVTYAFTSITDNSLTESTSDSTTVNFSTNDADGTYYYWLEVLTGTLTSADFLAGWATSGSRGSFTVSGGTGNFSLQVAPDGELEGNATFKLYISKGPATGAVSDSIVDLGSGPGTVTVVDDSTATYSVSAGNITEGDTFSFTVTATNYDNEDVSWTVTGDAASRAGVWGGALSGTLTSGDFSGGVATVNISTSDNTTTDSPNPANGLVTVTGDIGGSTDNDSFQISDPIPAPDPTYTMTVADIVEGEDLVLNIDAEDQNGEIIYLEVTGSGVTARVDVNQTNTGWSTNTPTNYTQSTTTLNTIFQDDQVGTVTLARGNYVSNGGTQLASDTFTMTDGPLVAVIEPTPLDISPDEGLAPYNWQIEPTSAKNIPDTSASVKYYWYVDNGITATQSQIASVTSTANSGQAIINVSDTTLISVGYKADDPNIPGTVLSKTATSVTMSSNLTATKAVDDVIVFYADVMSDLVDDFSGEVTVSSNAGTWSLNILVDDDQVDESLVMYFFKGSTTQIDVQGFTIQDKTPDTPSITSPSNGAYTDGEYTANATPGFTITTSAYSGPSSHATTDWQIASDAGFTTIIEQSLNDASNLTSWTPPELAEGTYYVRARHENSVASSLWSSTISFIVEYQPEVTLSNFTSFGYASATVSNSHYWGDFSYDGSPGDEEDGAIYYTSTDTVYSPASGFAANWMDDQSSNVYDIEKYQARVNYTPNPDITVSSNISLNTGTTWQDIPAGGFNVTCTRQVSGSGTETVVLAVEIQEKFKPTAQSSNTDSQDVTVNLKDTAPV